MDNTIHNSYGERMARMEEKTANIDDKVDKLLIKFDELDSKLDDKYSKKWVEKAVATMIGTICLAILSALLKLVILGA
jgi:hypothetical protein